jgi:hypothetical protein
MYKNYWSVKGMLCLVFLFLSIKSGLAQGTNDWLSNSSWLYRFTSTSGSGTNLDIRLNSSNFAAFNTNGSYFLFYKDIRSSSGLIGSYNSANLRFHTHGTERMHIRNSTGFVGINNTSPSHHLHIFGNTDYFHGGTVMMVDSNGNQASDLIPKTATNMGKSARISLTNSTTGNNSTDGALMMQNENNLNIWNQENGVVNIKSNNLNYALHGNHNRALLGSGLNLGHPSYALQTIHSTTDNGLYVQTNTASKYGVSVQVREETSTVFESTYQGAPSAQFRVYGNGEVYARKYVTTLNPFPDYVFSDDYALMSYHDLRNYIHTHKHLPNVPTAQEIEENDADLGEINRILVEKVEELTLYILELEDRLSVIENEESPTKAEENTLLERISRLENLLEQMKN